MRNYKAKHWDVARPMGMHPDPRGEDGTPGVAEPTDGFADNPSVSADAETPPLSTGEAFEGAEEDLSAPPSMTNMNEGSAGKLDDKTKLKLIEKIVNDVFEFGDPPDSSLTGKLDAIMAIIEFEEGAG